MIRDRQQYAFAAYGKPNPIGSSLIGYYLVDSCHGRVVSFAADQEYHSPRLEKRIKELKTKIQKELKKPRS